MALRPWTDKRVRLAVLSGAAVAVLMLQGACADGGAEPAPTVRVRVAGPMASGAPDVVSARTGEQVVVEAERVSAVWVFHGAALVVRCPGEACQAVDDGWQAGFRLDGDGRYRVVGVACATAVEPAPGFERSIAIARRCGDVVLRSIDARTRP